MATKPSLRLDKPTIEKNGGQGGRRGSGLISTSSSNDGSSIDYISISKVGNNVLVVFLNCNL